MVLTVTAEEYKLLSSFEEIRKRLLDEKFADRMERPLAYWGPPNDRRLPLTFPGRSLRDLLQTPFDALSATPGIGQKKIASLVRLLHRAAEEPPSAPQNGASPVPATAANHEVVSPHYTAAANGAVGELPDHRIESADPTDFDPATLSEGVWELWRDSIRRHRLGHEKLGRLASSLQNLPTVIWHTPLRAYLGYSLAEIRQLKTHGEKRIRAVLEVFFDIHQLIGSLPTSPRLSVCLRPAFIDPIEEWLDEFLGDSTESDADRAPKANMAAQADLAEVVQSRLSIPILNQIGIDSGPTVRELVEGRLGIQGAAQTVRLQSRKLGVTRARVYQLLDDCAKVADVRWPEGKSLLLTLAERLTAQRADAKAVEQVAALRELLFPEKYNSLEETGLG